MTGKARTRAKWGWLPVLLVMALIFVASSIPEKVKPKDPFTYADKTQHFIAYGILGLAAYGAARGSWSSRSRLAIAVSAVAIASLYGVTDELHQYFVPGRSMEFMDWVADTIGATVAVGIAQLRGLKGGP